MNKTLWSVLFWLINSTEPISLAYFWSKIASRRKRNILFWILAWGVFVAYFLFRDQLMDMASGHVIYFYIVKNFYVILYYAYAVLFYNISIRCAFINFSVCYEVSLMVELALSYMAINLYNHQESMFRNQVLRVVLACLLQTLELLVLYGLYRINKKYRNAIEHNALIFLVVINYVMDFVLFERYDAVYEQQPEAIFNFKILVLVVYQVFALVYFAYYLVTSEKKEQEFREAIQFTESQLGMLGDLDKKIEQSRRILHDINNHLSTIKILAEQGRNEDIEEYVESLIPEVKNARIPDVTDSVLYVIVYGKRMEAKRKKVELECMIGIQDISIPMHELNAIVGNILDNAIEASEKVPNAKERVIDFRIVVKEENLIIECQNPYVVEPCYDKNGELQTSKKDKLIHGHGIKQIYEYVSRHNGDVDIHFYQGTFTIRIILSNEIAM